ncbi:MAG TPA: DinB family protein [Isosphaeraceae bacterium]|nr:DinB family protein [Isosphaeraceae bacterium]
MNDDLFALYAYNRWANDRVVEAARALTPEQYTQGPAPGWTSVRATLVHIAGATWGWARALRGEAFARMGEAEVPTLDDAARLLAQGHDAFDHLLSTLTPEQLAATWTARDPRGVERRMPLWAAYRHVVNHATYHRGQVASKLKRLGVEPAVTDLVYWALERVEEDGE